MAKAKAVAAATTKVNLFKKAAIAATPTDAKKKKQTTWQISGEANPALKEVEQAIHEVIVTDSAIATLKNRNAAAKGKVSRYAEQRYIDAYATLGVPPETPMVVSNTTGESCTYVCQDRSSNSEVSQEQIDSMIDLLGEDRANEWLHRHDVFSLNPDVLTEEIFEPVTSAISEALTKLVEKGVMTTEQVENLISLKSSVKFKSGIVGRLGEVCGRDSTKIGAMLQILGSACPRYIKG